MTSLDVRLSKSQIMAIAGNLHHDECGIEAMFTLMKQADNPRVAYNAAWVLSHLSTEDKRIYLFPYYGELVDMAISAGISIRRGWYWLFSQTFQRMNRTVNYWIFVLYIWPIPKKVTVHVLQ